MKIETCVKISEDLLKEVDEFANGECDRSEVVEKALQKYIDDLKFRQRVQENAEKETEILNRTADERLEESRETMRFQAELTLESLNK
jgi:metal-responsive CopG/Arc/MetJ family transcriptional regulator